MKGKYIRMPPAHVYIYIHTSPIRIWNINIEVCIYISKIYIEIDPHFSINYKYIES
jgi:hypothetical protein